MPCHPGTVRSGFRWYHVPSSLAGEKTAIAARDVKSEVIKRRSLLCVYNIQLEVYLEVHGGN